MWPASNGSIGQSHPAMGGSISLSLRPQWNNAILNKATSSHKCPHMSPLTFIFPQIPLIYLLENMMFSHKMSSPLREWLCFPVIRQRGQREKCWAFVACFCSTLGTLRHQSWAPSLIWQIPWLLPPRPCSSSQHPPGSAPHFGGWFPRRQSSSSPSPVLHWASPP